MADLSETNTGINMSDVIVLDDSGELADTDKEANVSSAALMESLDPEWTPMDIDEIESNNTLQTSFSINLDNDETTPDQQLLSTETDQQALPTTEIQSGFNETVQDAVTQEVLHSEIDDSVEVASTGAGTELTESDSINDSSAETPTILPSKEDNSVKNVSADSVNQHVLTAEATIEVQVPNNILNPIDLDIEEENTSSKVGSTETVVVSEASVNIENEATGVDVENTIVVGESGEPEADAGECEELCIIPDTERVITQAEKDAAALVTPVRDATESIETSTNQDSPIKSNESAPEKYIVSNCTEETINACEQCRLLRKSKYKVTHGSKTLYVCDDNCLASYKSTMGNTISSLENNVEEKQSDTQPSPFSRKCMDCNKKIIDGNRYLLSWETLEFCNRTCLAKYQKLIGSTCAKCQAQVQDSCMGKYCVRFGYNIRQFCTSTCLEQYKKGLKVCSYCQKEMSEEGFLAPVTDKSLFKDFCTFECLDKYKSLSNTSERPLIEGHCSVCHNDKPTIVFEHKDKKNQFCGEPCFVAFKFVNNIAAGKCDMCNKYFDSETITEYTMYYDDAQLTFCSKGCQNVYIIAKRKIVSCSWCKVKKYNFDMIKHHSAPGIPFLTCSLNCLNQQLASWNKDSSPWTNCSQCCKSKPPLYHLTMSDESITNFCSYACVLGFQNQYPKPQMVLNEPVPVSGPKRFIQQKVNSEIPTIPIITSVQSLANLNGPATYGRKRTKQNGVVAQINSTPQTIVKTQIRQQIIIRPAFPITQRNMTTMCKVTMLNRGTTCKAITTANKAVQTDKVKDKVILIPIPVPIYVPLPLRMYSQPYPVPFPFPLPLPIPIFIPTTRNSSKGIMKEIKKIQAKMPSNPLEAELLMMADMVAGDKDKKEDATDSETEGEDAAEPVEERAFTPEPSEANSSFGEEVLQMAINMAAELDEPAVDLEGALTVNTVTAPIKSEHPVILPTKPDPPQVERRPRGRGRGSRGRRPTRRSNPEPVVSILGMEEPDPPSEPMEKPDANMCLKYTFGVNAWKQWVATKNAELEQTSSRAKLFKPEILQLTADELNYSLCLFVKEVRKPNGQEYAPDTIYYLCLGIQQYLYENNRIDNIFCDTYYEKFTDCLDEVAKKFSVLYNDSHYIITRVEEEHLWESKQLGAHSPHVLLSTLMFFNTKHFNLTSVEDNMQLSFSHIMKHWKRNSTHPGPQKSTGSRSVLLRFYPPQTASDGSTTRKKKVYEQQENEENPLRCPVKLYEFYLSKCPESVKTRNDVFYLLPERSCVPDSPVWYSTSALPRDALEKMLHRVKMVKEINVALLTS